MRTNGNININVENNLVRYRLLANLFAPIDDVDEIGIRQITEKQKALKVDFEYIPDKNKVLYKKYPAGKEVSILFEELKNPRELILAEVANVFEISFDLNGILPGVEIDNDVIEESKKYIIRKLVKIAVTYSIYSDYFDEPAIKLKEELLEEYLKKLKSDKSHITYKLKQAINYFKYADLYEKSKHFTLLTINDSNRLDNYVGKSDFEELTDIIELLPPPIFKPIIWLENNDGTLSDFERLSSGEKQFIHTVSSILYHLKNIDSVNYSSEKLVIYRNVNLLMDEIELYYHPELQREYLYNLLKMIGKLSIPNIDAINICFVTHSPFILSDIPNSNILFLNTDGLPDKKAELVNTFGANIHDLLKHSFFLTKGTIGEVAKLTILNLVEYLKRDLSDDSSDEYWNQTNSEQFIEKVGEPLVKERLEVMFDKKFFTDNKEAIQRRIEKLQSELTKKK